MKERPILFSRTMVQAILDGKKNQTRRIVKYQRGDDCFVMLDYDGVGWWPYSSDDGESANVDGMEYPYRSPYGQPGDRLWVREAWRTIPGLMDDKPPRDIRQDAPLRYEADGEFNGQSFHPGKLRPSMFMPRWASRLLLEVTGVRVERLQDISEADAVAEGVEPFVNSDGDLIESATTMYEHLWESINGAGSWEANPWVWVVEFQRVTT